ncbi:MAG TPA: hypothetical protein VFX96_19105 [Pyrinomonadaceae bacterium]|nr:hypothetical protein [Pyrinomonadaceae bacterium]
MTRLQHIRRASETAALILALTTTLAAAPAHVSDVKRAPARDQGSAPQEIGPPASERIGRTRSFNIRVGQTVSLRPFGLSVRLMSVTEDSRCPVGVECVWAGNVRLSLRLSSPGGATRRVSLNTATEPTEVVYRGRRVRILEVRPPKREGRNIRQRDYRIRLEVSL